MTCNLFLIVMKIVGRSFPRRNFSSPKEKCELFLLNFWSPSLR